MKKLVNLTYPQKAILFTEQFYKNTSINNVVGYLKIEKNTNFEALERAFNYLVVKNDSYKLKFKMENNIMKQYVDDFIYEKLEIIDLENEEQLLEFERKFSKKSFNLEECFLFNAVMLRFPDTSGILVLGTHHLISDAWSMTLTLEEIYDNYNKIIDGENIELVSNPSYLNFVNSNELYSQSEKYEKDKEYWEGKFKNLPNVISLKNENTSIVSSRKVFDFNEKLLNKINDFCKKNNISIYIFLLSIFGIYFRNIFNAKQFVIGNPVLNRSNFNEKHTMGMFVSVVPFVFNINDSASFIEFSNFVASEQKQMYRHIKYPYHEILNYVRKEHDFSGSLYDIVFSYQNATIPSYCKWLPNFSQAESLQIHVKSLDSENSLSIHYDYLTNIFSDSSIDYMHKRILTMINQVLENEEISISDFEVICEDEKKDFFDNYNQTKCNYPKKSNIVKEFEKIVKKYPDKIAVKDKENALTYKQLNTMSNILAKRILETNIDTDIVAFALRRSVYIYVAILGILKSGHTYMPIDIDYPRDRINFMLENSKTQILITTKDFKENINYNGNVIDLENIDFSKNEKNLDIDIMPDKKAYIMYTSGSTGVPKAVTIKHHNVLNFVSAMQKCLNYNPEKDLTVLSVTTVCFDIFVFETFPTLLSGLQLFIADELEARSPKLLNEVIVKNKITKILTTPSRVQLLFEDNKYTECLKELEEIILGGEPFPELLLNNLKNMTSARLLNLYGPTETTVYSTFKDLTNETEITIGKPIDNTQIYILNENNKLLPNEIVGEICIAGDGVGLGYYLNKEKTETVFIENPYKTGDVIYKTGDLGYWNKNKELICLGRKDHQIKIRGYRIELDDISNNIMTFDNIKKCVVIDKDDKNGKKYLIAYLVSDEKIDILNLRKYLIDYLPNYMIPSYFVQLEKIPLTLNHKVDRKALPEPSKDSYLEENIVQPVTDTEKKLHKIIKKSLKISKMSIDSDLFTFNIDSLDIIRIQTELLEENIRLNTQDFYKYRTIKKLAEIIDNKNEETQIVYNESILKTANNSFFKHTKVAKFVKNEYKNILITGVSGYLGMHLLYEIINNTNSKITCILRNKKQVSAETRLQELYKFYFNKKLPVNRLEIIEADITNKNIGLTNSKYKELSTNVDLVINTAANVRYYGEYEEFKKINVDLPDKLSDFCIENNIKLIHISTLGVSGNYLINLDKNYNIFQEDDFYIGQKYTENVYIQTKFEAEMLIYGKISKGLNASIIRVGNLTGRFEDGHFQSNIEENAFYNILRMILKYNILPNTMLNQYLEFTPVDLCAKAIVQLVKNVDYSGYVFHLFNQNYLSAQKLIEILEKLNKEINILTGNEFKNQILKLSKEYPEENILKGIVNDIDDNVGLTFTSTVQQQNSNTNFYLDKLGFNWPKIDDKYIEKIIDYMKKNKYI